MEQLPLEVLPPPGKEEGEVLECWGQGMGNGIGYIWIFLYWIFILINSVFGSKLKCCIRSYDLVQIREKMRVHSY